MTAHARALSALGFAASLVACSAKPPTDPNAPGAETGLRSGTRCAFNGRVLLSDQAEDFLAASNRAKREIDGEELRTTIRDRYDEFRGCYQAGLRNDAALGGRVHMAFIIEPDGTVSSAAPTRKTWTADQSRWPLIEDCDVLTCLVTRFRELRFKPSPNGKGIVTVVYPIVFTPPAP